MPHLNVVVSGRPDKARSGAIAAKLTELTNTHLGKEPALTAVAVGYVGHEHWFIGGEALSEADGESFSLHIAVTEATNTKPQIAAYVEAVFTAMSDLLGGVRDESYVVVSEVPAAAWGYAGKTQEYRFIAGQIARAA